MAFINLTRSSKILEKQISVQAILPDELHEGEKLPVIWLLHGLGDNGTCWQRKTNLEQLVAQKQVAVIMPDMQRSFYSNMIYGGNYWDYLVEELMPQMRAYFPLSKDPWQNYLVGNSMGGYGAVKLALKYPQSFSAVAAISPVTNLAVVPKIMTDYQAVFGEKIDSANQLENMIQTSDLKRLKEISWYFATGDDDFMKADCDNFVKFLSAKLSVKYITGPGNHDWDYWNQQLKQVLDWLPLKRGEQ